MGLGFDSGDRPFELGQRSFKSPSPKMQLPLILVTQAGEKSIFSTNMGPIFDSRDRPFELGRKPFIWQW